MHSCPSATPMPRTPSAIGACFDDPEHADVVIHVFVDTHADSSATDGRGGTAGEAAAAAARARAYHAHTVILSTYSSYFKAQLSSAWSQEQPPPQQQQQEAGGTAPCSGSVRSVDVHVEPEELGALHELLLMMYSQVLPAAAPPTETLFFQCLSLADRFQAASCVDLLVAALAAVPSTAMDCKMLQRVFQTAPGVRISRSYPALLASATTALLRLFGEVPKVIMDKDLLHQFCALPHAAALAWVQSDELRVDSENCVVFLLSAWVQANQDSTAAQHEELAHQIRVFHLGPAYQHHILPNLSWFKGCSGMQHLPAVLTCIRAGVLMKEGPDKEKEAYFGLDCPPAWVARPRLRSTSPRTGSWVMSSRQLKRMDGGSNQKLSPSVYVNGFLMRIDLDSSADEEAADPSAAAAPSRTLGVYCGVSRVLMKRSGVPVPDRTMLPVGPVSLRVGSPNSQKSKEDDIGGPCVLDCDRFWGVSDFLSGSTPTLLRLVAPYLLEEQLQFQAVFTWVDMARKA